MPERSYRVLLWALALTGLLADQATKYGVFSWLYNVEGNSYSLFRSADGGGFHLDARFQTHLGTPLLDDHGRPMPHVNHGALFGLLSKHETAANLGFAAISLLAALAIIYWSMQKATARDRWLCASLGLILAGTLGNFYDRVTFNGVRDFLHWDYAFDWPVFNIADCCLVCGAALLLLQAFSAPPQPAPEGAQGADARNKEPAGALASTACVGVTPGPKA